MSKSNDGKHEKYFEDKTLHSRYFIVDGKYHGTYEEYHRNGKLYYKTKYKHGNPDGFLELHLFNGTSKFRTFKANI